ncbi:cadherin-7-like [Salvelinus fontinalis]|uniref:cadherin-7-like n=1 Tax=Salvelinus fontinalis TaxID=8038 RepID=UPI00248562C4|nr:cadherin-7-like [Salvelinus fontinalis]XP_055723644.1 cadherin-7-like [Salvelinus fontinalis]XP_055723645.1 cadherin-7-like [Salvelinus fontinalis]
MCIAMMRLSTLWSVVSLLTLLLLPLWEMGCSGLSFNSIPLPPVGTYQRSCEGGAHHRQRRSWVWNQFFVLEEYTGDEPLYVGKLHSDVDKGEGQVKYVLNGQGATSIFTIDENTGDIHATKRLDREEQAYYTLRAQARNRKNNLPVEPESEFVIKVQDINDNEPKFLDGPYSARVPEMSPVGTSVVTVVATDADDPTYGNSARVIYSILEGQPYFSVEPKTGVVKTALPNMDREARDQYLLVIQAKDMVGQMGGLSGTTSVMVTLTDVNDNPPHFSRKSYQFSMSESLPVASVVAKIKTLDSDVGPNAEMEYRIVDGDGLGLFRITPDRDTQEGLITLQKGLDFETKSSYTLRVEVSNRNIDLRFLSLGPFSDTATVRLIVENVDEPPVFSLPLSKMLISEAAKVGTTIGTVSAHDPDSTNSPIRYSIDRNTDLERFFNIDATTGVISTAKPLDREVNAIHNITIFAMESLHPLQVGKGIILITVTDINDNAPVFAIEYETYLCESARPGQIIETISAMDRDEPQSGHRFFFSLTAEAAGNLNFTLRDNKDNTASVLTKRGGFQRHDQTMYRLPVLIMDGGSPALSSTNTLSIRVCDCDPDGALQSCGSEASMLSAGLSTGALIAILACILTLLVLVLLIVTMRRRKKEPLILDEERDVRENIVRYDDEGGGEEDTEAFDMVALRNLKLVRESGGKTRRDVTPEVPTLFLSSRPPPDNGIFRDFIWDRLKEADVDPSAPPYDSLQTYAYEGSGSAAESLSSLDSLSTDSEQNYDYLSDWGPRFKKLADLYGHSDDGNLFAS